MQIQDRLRDPKTEEKSQIIQARDISLEELQSEFNLQLSPVEDFFGELQTDFSGPTISHPLFMPGLLRYPLSEKMN